ncbi:hypothetical protein [Delftia tsuruhatensis]|uniref:Lipoprotein n=1 Tax=Delftia tsuruhatensis TaxID=180282 RepID=A0AAX3SPI2_9BURK|nr:hypothetical protein [Delftia tsuruhatensis]WFF81971.1 hypothetical protein PYR84_04595 [Delftia tsuruhatensis]
MNTLTKIPGLAGMRRILWGAGVAGALVLAGCATTTGGEQSKAQKPEEAVTQRSNEFWKVRMAGDVGQAYAFTTPGYRAVNSLEKYRLNHGAVPSLSGGSIAWVKCDDKRCEVRKNFTTSSPVMGNAQIPISISEIWTQEDGQWWLFLE